MFTPRLLLAICGLTAVHAHMQLEYPPPFNASNNPHRTGPADNIYVYPAGCCGREDTKATCRGYLSLLGTPEGAPVATWAAGSKVTWNITGDPAITLNDLGGTHYGGSCQVGFSTDGGETFKVAASYEGNCPHRNSELGSGQNFDLTIPEDLPAGEAVFAWTWINREQEFTMNCAAVTITNDNDSDGEASSSAAPSYAPAATQPASSAAPEPSTTAIVQSSTQAAATPSSSGKPVNGGAKQFSLEWCSCDCETASDTTDEEDAYEASNCDCKCWKKPQSINKRTESHLSRHIHRHVSSNFESNKQRRGAKQQGIDLQQKRATAWAARSDLFVPDPIWHDCKLPLTTSELQYPDPGDQVVKGDGEYPLELPSTSPCESDQSG
ncbi:hypothetical protein GTA08_BOTSDO07276 [Botryosphaeria dothidea]|uniref:Lytic polysaccharide monooxygenase n=1 Tax=Botryosphaeria dothidea TaxID=55169 RepID=A0A8H4N2Z5_9PEZI|nr:hypothetical protein GTA08_BOTSDO11468 [Botryosphaeria dothidea]KAF4305989.1 hypothetical protein GTA08_BOTSDO07276 [Botryosphaeria dothidea]